MKNQKGFSVIEGLLLLVIIGILAGVGWFVWQSNNEANESLSKSENTRFAEPVDTGTFTLAGDNFTYENKYYGFKLTYPKAMGKFKEVQNHDTRKDLITLASDDVKEPLGKNTKGSSFISVWEEQGFDELAASYGPRVAYSSAAEWVVTEDNEFADTAELNPYKKGDIYPAKVKKEIEGIKLYDFTSEDEGCLRPKYVAKVDKVFITVIPTQLCKEQRVLGLEDKQAYQAKVDSIIKSFSLL